MLNVFTNRKDNILNYITGDFSKKFINNKNYLFLNQINLSKKKEINQKIKNLELIIIKKKKKNIFQIFYFIQDIYRYRVFKKNFILVYKFKNYISANNFLPDWPANYQKLNAFSCCYIWIKNASKVIFFYNRIEMIILERT